MAYILIQSGDESFYKARSQWISEDGCKALVVESGRYYIVDTHTARIKGMYRDKQSAINYALLAAQDEYVDYEQIAYVRECYKKLLSEESYRKVFVNE